jgi:hypothetical protein
MHRLILIACLAALSLPAGADTTGAGAPTALRQAALSADLYARGMAADDSLSVLAAARLRKASGIDPAAGGEGLLPSWQEMLAEAERLADGDAALLGLIADAGAETAKGVASGPFHNLSSVPAGAETTVAELAFRGGEYAEVYLEAAPGTDINLTIRDADGNLVCADTHGSHVAYCGWTPASDGVFILTIHNQGSRPADYALMTN